MMSDKSLEISLPPPPVIVSLFCFFPSSSSTEYTARPSVCGKVCVYIIHVFSDMITQMFIFKVNMTNPWKYHSPLLPSLYPSSVFSSFLVALHTQHVRLFTYLSVYFQGQYCLSSYLAQMWKFLHKVGWYFISLYKYQLRRSY